MSEKVLSIFIDESGDFGKYAPESPYYIIVMVIHDQTLNISSNIRELDNRLTHLPHAIHNVHCGPLIRGEDIYLHDEREHRKKIFGALFHFARKTEFKYITTCLPKKEVTNGTIDMSSRLSKAITLELERNDDYLRAFDKIVIYYDNGQTELTKIIMAVFNARFTQIELRKILPSEKKLFQVADLICTLELTEQKIQAKIFSNSEKAFFKSPKDFRKNFYKSIRKKRLSN